MYKDRGRERRCYGNKKRRALYKSKKKKSQAQKIDQFSHIFQDFGITSPVEFEFFSQVVRRAAKIATTRHRCLRSTSGFLVLSSGGLDDFIWLIIGKLKKATKTQVPKLSAYDRLK